MLTILKFITIHFHLLILTVGSHHLLGTRHTKEEFNFLACLNIGQRVSKAVIISSGDILMSSSLT
jgi:hypothetical protein